MNDNKRLFQILDEMNQHDTEHGTKLVTLHPDLVRINANSKKGIEITMGVPLGVIDATDYILAGNPKKRLVLMIVDGAEFDKRNK